MQASQSNNASDLQTLGLNPDPHPDTNLSRTFPSPFSAPIQAAWRQFLPKPARQKVEFRQADNPGSDIAGVLPPKASETDAFDVSGKAAAENADTLHRTFREDKSREEASRERDRRLERSLYEGHSIEAGLNFEGAHGSAAAETAGAERASLAESDGSESLFRYAIPGPLPDPEAVRGAIFRLARASEQGRESRLISENDSVEAGDVAALESSANSPTRSLNFGDVARRVWEASVVQSDAPGVKELASERGMRSVLESIAEPRPTPTVTVCDVEAQPALAHDAGNLLSALTLYSELLGSPGVLDEQYRHYAEELKLLSLRSRVLIDRLLQGAEMRTERTSARESFGAGIASDDTSSQKPVLDVTISDDGDADVRNCGLQNSGAPEPPCLLETDPGPGFGRDAETTSVRLQTVEAISRSQPTGAAWEPAKKEPVIAANGGLAAGSRVELAGPALVRRATTEETNLGDLLMRWGSLLSTMVNGTLEVVVGPGAATPIPAPAEALERILVNLVRNARTATLEGGSIRIGVGVEEGRTISEEDKGTSNQLPETGGTMVLTVDDSGCGMTESQVRKILGEEVCSTEPVLARRVSGEELDEVRQTSEESFADRALIGEDPGGLHRGRLERRRGLGLQIVRELVAYTGGTIAIQSWPGRGTRIEIRWPVSAASIVRTTKEDEMSDWVKGSVDQSPAVLLAVEPIAAGTSATASTSAINVPQSAPLEITRGKVGPDGFSEMELRSMMLRLHRSGPQERSPLSRRLSNRPAETRAAERTFGAAEKAIHSVSSYGHKKNDPAQEDVAAKGAIAC